MTFLEVRNLTKRFGATRALAGLSLEQAEGEVLALLGPTGAGKTTTLLSIAGLERPDAGEIRLAGADLARQPANERDVAMVFEGLNLFPNLSVRENIALPLKAPGRVQPAEEIERRIAQATGQLRIDHLLERTPEGLSGGETQRVALARALVRRSALYLLDEPLSALDLKLREDLQAELRSLHAHYGSTLLYATHDFHGATAVADRLALIAEGRVIQSGRLDEILARPLSMTVGRLIGSPRMAFLAARRDGDRIVLEGDGPGLSLDAFRPEGEVPERPAVGVWPEDLALSPEGTGGHAGTVYAVSRRGIDKAIQVDGAFGSFRKAVPLDFPAEQDRPLRFDFAPERAFLFDTLSGAVLSGPIQEARP